MLIAVPAIAVANEPSELIPIWKGHVAGIDYETSIVTVDIAEIYLCANLYDCTEQTEPSCVFEAVDSLQISAEISGPGVYDSIKIGDPVIGMSYEDLGSEQWLSLAEINEGDDIHAEAVLGQTKLPDTAPLTEGYAFILIMPDNEPLNSKVWDCILCGLAMAGCTMGGGVACDPNDIPVCHWCKCGKYPCNSEIIEPTPTPTPTPVPTPTPAPTPTVPPAGSELYLEDIQYGYGSTTPGQSTVYQYRTSGSRTAIEWYVQPIGCDAYEPPVIMATSSSISSMREVYPSCDVDFDLYVYKNCDPRTSHCNALYADVSDGSGAYVGIPYPDTGAWYYVQVHNKHGSSPFHLIARSYTGSDAPVIMIASDELYTAKNVASPA